MSCHRLRNRKLRRRRAKQLANEEWHRWRKGFLKETHEYMQYQKLANKIIDSVLGPAFRSTGWL